MPIDPSAVGSEFGPGERSWNSKDALIYSLGVGASLDELPFVTENTRDVPQQVLPTMCVILGGGGMGRGFGTFNPAMLVDGGREITLHGPIPVEGKVKTTGKITGIYDKGSGAVVETQSHAVDAETDEPRWDIRQWMFIRGEGGFGGDRGPSGPRNVPPERAPDKVVSYTTRPDQALMYRLSGDRNPLHSDPSFAKMAGFEKPILHGLCTFGFTGRALLHGLAEGDPSKFGTMEGRFSKPVYPGDTLSVKMWVDGNEAVYVTETQNGDVVVDQGRFVVRS